MVKSSTTFRFDEDFLDFIERMARDYGMAKTDVVRQSTLITGAMFAEAGAHLLADLVSLRERYGDDAELLCQVGISASGAPIGLASIDGKAVGDVRCVPYVDRQGSVARCYLEVDREGAQGPNHIPFGKRWLLVEPQTSIGDLPWPPQQNRAIKVRLGDLAGVLEEAPLEAVLV